MRSRHTTMTALRALPLVLLAAIVADQLGFQPGATAPVAVERVISSGAAMRFGE